MLWGERPGQPEWGGHRGLQRGMPLTHPSALLPFAGAQYAAWRPDSRRLAVSSDGLHAVFVYDVGSRQQVRSGPS